MHTLDSLLSALSSASSVVRRDAWTVTLPQVAGRLTGEECGILVCVLMDLRHAAMDAAMERGCPSREAARRQDLTVRSLDEALELVG